MGGAFPGRPRTLLGPAPARSCLLPDARCLVRVTNLLSDSPFTDNSQVGKRVPVTLNTSKPCQLPIFKGVRTGR